MKRLVLILITLLSFGSLMTPAVAGTFGFGINDAGGEDETIVATHEIAVGGTKDDQEEGFVDNVVKSVVNWFLGILGLVALIVMLYGGFLMLTSVGNEETYNKGRKVLRAAAIGIVLIGVAWFVLSLIFRLIVQASDSVGVANTQN